MSNELALAAKLKRLEDAHNAVYWNADQRREAMDDIFAEEPVVSLIKIHTESIAKQASAIDQLKQAFSVGALRGDEFDSCKGDDV